MGEEALKKKDKIKQIKFYNLLDELEDNRLTHSSPTWYHIGTISSLSFFVSEVKKLIDVPNCNDSVFIAWLDGVLDIMKKIKEIREVL